uniref:hypothetical protein n=1 Tax=Algoriphagus sp. TaxID=1872435 RepID=UPI004048BAC1
MNKSLKILLGVVVLLGFSLWVINQLKSPSNLVVPESIDSKESQNQNSKSLLELINAEPKVKEAIITDSNVLYVSVEDDGTKRDGFANYLCELIKEKGSNIMLVKVVKVNSTKDPNRDNAYGLLLGEADCK